MERKPEPELMDAVDQARAYSQADFSDPNSLFLALFQRHFPDLVPRHILDLGCGPADICIRFAETYTTAEVTGVDGAEAMLAFAREAIEKSDSKNRIRLVCDRIQDVDTGKFDALISNSLLHHLAAPDDIWRAIQRLASTGAAVMVMDLMRPPTETAAHSIVETYASDQDVVLRRDFFHSLCAAFTVDEVRTQLHRNGLAGLSVENVSDRHLLVYGRMEN